MPTQTQIVDQIYYWADRLGIPRAIALATAQEESGFNQSARSPVGAIGIFQLMPGTAQGMGVNPYNWQQNIHGGIMYLDAQQDRFGSWFTALRAYNGGPGGINIPSTARYATNVLAIARNQYHYGSGGVGPPPATPPGTAKPPPAPAPTPSLAAALGAPLFAEPFGLSTTPSAGGLSQLPQFPHSTYGPSVLQMRTGSVPGSLSSSGMGLPFPAFSPLNDFGTQFFTHIATPPPPVTEPLTGHSTNTMPPKPGIPQLNMPAVRDWIADWHGQNGRIPFAQLTLVHKFYVAPVMAASLNALLAAAVKAHVITQAAVNNGSWATGTYRSYSTEVYLWRGYQNYLAARRHEPMPYPGVPVHPAPAAAPGTSNHGWGLAIDFNTSFGKFIGWLHANAFKYGFHGLSFESWHFAYGIYG